MLIRQIQREDAEQLMHLKLLIDQETHFMLFEPNERKTTVEEQRQQIESTLAKGGMIFVVEHEQQLIGYLGATSYALYRIRHSVTLVIGVVQAFTGQGIGTHLFVVMEGWARKKRLHRLELTVMTDNVAGLALYKKRGFTIEGTRKDAYIVNGQYVDEYMMAKLL